MKFTVQSGSFLNRLEEMTSEFAGQQLGARIEVPPEMSWWYVQEWGSATHAESPDFPSSSPGGYSITPDTAKALRFYDSKEGEVVTRLHVHHPGVRARHMVGAILNDIMNQVGADVTQSLQDSEYEFSALRDEFLGRAMTHAKDMITESFAEKLPGNPDDPLPGKLGGRKAADVFADEAKIIEET